ncbi:uncharacterized protein LOC111248609 isoform X3 [Varroa destructor]|nr:uncharacterized protein LOC111248609 isoform X3 [Varroa destructor]
MQPLSAPTADMGVLEEFQKRRNLEQLELARLAKSVASQQGHSGPLGREHRDRERVLSARLRDRIYDSYVGYLGWLQEQQALGRDEDMCSGAVPAKQKRHQLEELITDYVCQVSQREKYHLGVSFELILRQTIETKSAAGFNFDPLRTAEAFRWLERYACNLLVQPWREEFRKIKLYGGFYKHKIERYLCQSEAVLELLGYVRQGNCMLLPAKPLDPDDVTFVALDCLIANVECKILLLLKSGVRHFDSRWLDIYNTRCQLHGASISECAIVLNHQYEQKLHSQRALESMYKEMENLGYGAGARLGDPRGDLKADLRIPDLKDSRVDKIVVTAPLAPLRKPSRHQIKGGQLTTSSKVVPNADEDDDRRFRNDLLVDEGYARSRGNGMYRDGVSLSGGEGSKRVTPGAPLSHSMGSNVTSQMAIAPPQISSHHLAREKAAQRTSGGSSNNSYKLHVPTEQGNSSGVPFALPKLGLSPTPPSGTNGASISSQHSTHASTSSTLSIGVGTSSLRDDDRDRSGGTSSRDSRQTDSRDGRKRDKESRERDLLIDHRDETDKTFSSSQNDAHGASMIDDDAWPCAVCTFLNEPSAKICIMCSKSRHLHSRPPVGEPLVSGGRECPSCTLINPKSAQRCEACNNCLLNSPTYI